ncbi:uncharacterized protein LOC107022283 [Solanum pennellii]|uniref:Uncharacterized protein LOC107022283 n=1 Tax=Solanum pennellii TaxID=28526 RepID=A0ABM1H012_SOLPN|nr:uncharacterized protein LOC107022283 [Solanum pennellii]
MTQANRYVGPRVNALESTMTSRLRNFVRMNLLTFLCSKVTKDPQAFLDEVYKIVHAMCVSSREKADFASYQLKEFTQVWLIVYANSIEDSNLQRMVRDVKRGRIDEQGQPRFNKRDPNQYVPSALKENYEKESCSQVYRPTFSNCENKHFGKFLSGSRGCYGCGNNDHKVRDCPTIVARGRYVKKAPYNDPIMGNILQFDAPNQLLCIFKSGARILNPWA